MRKQILDYSFTYTIYNGHPHNLAFMLPAVGTESVCGANAETVEAHFAVKSKVTSTSHVQEERS